MFKLIQTHTHLVITLSIAIGVMGFGLYIIGSTSGEKVFADHEMNYFECQREYESGTDERETCLAHADQQNESPCEEDETEVSVDIISNEDNCVPKDDMIWTYLNWTIRFLTSGVGLVVAVMIAVSGIQYVMAGDNPEMMQKAKSRLKNAVIALLLFIFMTAILNYLMPGGLI